jgi:hypothetical protein
MDVLPLADEAPERRRPLSCAARTSRSVRCSGLLAAALRPAGADRPVGGAGFVPAFLLKRVLEAIGRNDTRALSIAAAAMIGIAIVTGVLSVIQTLLSNQVGQRVMHDLRAAVFRHLQRLSLAFFTRTRTGECSHGSRTTSAGSKRRHEHGDLDRPERDHGGGDGHRHVPPELAARAVPRWRLIPLFAC